MIKINKKQAALNIKKLRMMLNLSQTQLSNILHVQQAAVCQWERGTRMPSAIHCMKLLQLAEEKNIKIDIFDLRATR